MLKRSRVYPNRHRLLFAIASLACCCLPRAHVAAASTATPPSLISSSTTPPPAAASEFTTSSTAERRLQNNKKVLSNFFNKFESYGPTLTLTLRDPSTTALLGGGDGDRAKSKVWTPRSSRAADASKIGGDDGTFGISSKLAALFHISPSAPAANSGQTASSSSSSSTTSQFADGYMLDDGEIFLDPPSPTTTDGQGSSLSRGLFSIRNVGSGILGGSSTMGKSLSECAQNVHPEMRYEMRSREVASPNNNDSNGLLLDDDTRPFPSTAPWLSAISCGMIWSPFPMYKTGYPDNGNYGHKLMSVPHFLRCGARISLPRISRSTSRGIDNSFRSMPKTTDLDLGVSYSERMYSPAGGGTLELLLGKSRSSLPPANSEMNNANSMLQSDNHRRNNHLLLRLATGRKSNSSNQSNNSIASSIEYAKASFRLPTPFFLRSSNNKDGDRGRVSVSPSFDFVEGTARCVLSGDVGSSGRTRAVLRLDAEDSTLTVVRALDESKIIAPTISLNTGKIVYDYYLNLDGISGRQHDASFNEKVNSSIRAHVDPTKGIILKWTDGIQGRGNGSSGGSCWVTECRIPLGTTAAGPLAADVRVGRRWVI